MLKFLRAIKVSLLAVIGQIDKQIKIEEAAEENKDQMNMDIEHPPSRNELILKTALREIGVKEVKGSGNDAKVVEYHKYASKGNDREQPDSVPWCSSFICWVVEHCFPSNGEGKPMGSTNSMMARSWLKWGVSSKVDPLPGDIVVYWRGDKAGWKGHVGIFLRKNANGSIVTLGGNQSDEVNISSYSEAKLLDIRRSSKARVYDADDVSRLNQLAYGIINGKYINDGGKVT